MNVRIGNPRWHAPAALALGALVWTGASRAGVSCSVRIASPGTPEWDAAARDAEGRTSRTSPIPHDCQSIEVTVRADGAARVEFLATDGRRAVREIQNPNELGPAIDALLVTIAPAPVASVLPEDNSLNSVIHDRRPIQGTQSSSPAPPPPRTLLVIGAGAGSRFTFGHKYLTPSASLRATGVFDRWEVGVFGEWDPVYARLAGKSPPGFAMSALFVGAVFGRRESASRLEVNYGLGLGIASVAASADPDPSIANARNVDASQRRVAVYAGARYPRDKTIRVTLDLMSDAALSGLRGAATSDARLPPFPRYGLSLSVGIEAVAL